MRPASAGATRWLGGPQLASHSREGCILENFQIVEATYPICTSHRAVERLPGHLHHRGRVQAWFPPFRTSTTRGSRQPADGQLRTSTVVVCSMAVGAGPSRGWRAARRRNMGSSAVRLFGKGSASSPSPQSAPKADAWRAKNESRGSERGGGGGARLEGRPYQRIRFSTNALSRTVGMPLCIRSAHAGRGRGAEEGATARAAVSNVIASHRPRRAGGNVAGDAAIA